MFKHHSPVPEIRSIKHQAHCFREPSEWLLVIMNSAGSFPGKPGHRSTEQSGVGSRSWSHLQSWTSFMALLSPPGRKIRTLPDFWGDPLLRESDSFKLPEAFLKHLTNTYRTALPSQWQCLLRTTPPHTHFSSRSPFSPFLAPFQHSLPRVLLMQKNHWSWPVSTQLASLFLQALGQAP